MASEVGPQTVRAVHNFKGTNNDELCFKKGDIITLTQTVEGGWWEGTLNGVTGWFPSNYVKEHKTDAFKPAKGNSEIEPVVQVPPQDMEMYRAVVFKDILDTELVHVNEMTEFWQNYLFPLKQSECLAEKDWVTLTGNWEEVFDTQKLLLGSLENIKELGPKDQKIGGAFMQVAPHLKKIHLIYCAQHANAVAVIEKNKEILNKFIEDQNSNSTVLVLTTGLSSPFRRLEKYPALLQELQRHTEESHIDRGDSQRAVFVYRDISSCCQNKRRQKEMELEVMTGNIRGWEGEDIHLLGDILHMGVVTVIMEDQNKKDRHFVLFPQTLVMLSVSSRLSAFIYKGKLPLSGVNITKIEGSEFGPHAFEITGNMIQRFLVCCHSKEDLETWMLFLRQQLRVGQSATLPIIPARTNITSSPSLQEAHCRNSTGNSSHVSQLQITLTPNSSSPHQPPLPPHVMDARLGQNSSNFSKHLPKKAWAMWSLRPHPPIRTCPPPAKKDEVVLRRAVSKKKDKVPDEKAYEDDMRVLQVIEAYCNSAKTRYTVNSALLDCPQMIIAEEKIFVEDIRGTVPGPQEKSLVDTVYALRDQVKELKEETTNLAKGLTEERKARKKLEELMKKHLGGIQREILSGILED